MADNLNRFNNPLGSMNRGSLLVNEFKIYGGARLIKLVSQFKLEKDLDYSIKSAIHLFHRGVSMMEVASAESDLQLPREIRDCKEYKNSLFTFTEYSLSMMLGLAFYLGECFVRSHAPALHWDSGRKEECFAGMPVIDGFLFKMQLPVFHVTLNIYSTLVKGDPGCSENPIDSAISVWEKYSP